MADVIVVIQARMGSNRLPGKVLLDIGGKPMLEHVVERSRANRVDEVVIATTTEPQDDPIVDWCERFQTRYVRGSEQDVLGRYLLAADTFQPAVIVRVTADCPLMDPSIIDRTIEEFESRPNVRYAATRMPDQRTYPIGLDVEVFDVEMLREAGQNAVAGYQREHVTPYMYDGSTDYEVFHVTSELACGEERWTVDTRDDLELVRRLVKALPDGSTSWLDVLDVLNAHPDWRKINQEVVQKSYRETQDGN